MFKSILFSLVKQAGIEEMKILISKLKESDNANFETDIKAAYLLFKRLSIVAESTKTNIDDTVVSIFTTAIEDYANENNISL